MAVPPTIPPVPEAAIATFPAADLASGTGTQLYYGLVGKESGGLTYNLVEFSSEGSWLIETGRGAGTDTLTFDSAVFNLPRYVKGTAFFAGAIRQDAGGTSCSAQLYHWDGSTATALSAEITSGALAGSPNEHAVYLKLPITTEKMIKKGDQVRIVVKLIVPANNGTLYHSPTGQASPTSSSTDTQMVVGVPFRIGA